MLCFKSVVFFNNNCFKVIGSGSVDSRDIEFFRPRIEQICPVLMEHAMCAEEGTRNVVSECLGKLCLVHPEYLLPRLKVKIFILVGT